MANISQFQLNDTIYDIKDDNAVRKSGDIINGSLALKNTWDINEPQSSNIYYDLLKFYDKNNVQTGYLNNSLYSSGAVCTGIGAYNGNTSQGNNLTLGIHTDGTKYVYVTDPDAWRDAIKIGSTRIEYSSDAISCANNTRTNLISFTVPTNGYYLIKAKAYFASNTSGSRYAGIRVDSNVNSMGVIWDERVIPPSNGGAHCDIDGILSAVTTVTYKLFVIQNSGAALNATGYIYLFRIG